jgi:hypothetical protein
LGSLNHTAYFCAPCNRAFEESATKAVRAGTSFVRVCPVCGTLTHRQTSEIVARASHPLAVEMMLAYAFPFRPASLVALGPMALLLAFACWSVHGVLLGVVCYGLMLAMIFAIVRATASGDDRITVDSIFLDRGEIAGVIARYLILVLVCALPLIVAWACGLPEPAYAAAILLGYLYFPAGLITSSQHASTLLDALVGYRVILAMPVAYFTAVACMTPAALVWLGSFAIARGIVDVRPLVTILNQVISLFAFAIVARICGILLREEM